MIKHIHFNKLCTILYHSHRLPDFISDWLLDHSLSHAICRECMDFYSKYQDGNYVYVSNIVTSWKEIFMHVCYYLGIGSRSANVLWKELANGNWSHLHYTDEEKELTQSDWFETFMMDVFYCSDRWSLDRLTRCHWAFRQWKDSNV